MNVACVVSVQSTRKEGRLRWQDEFKVHHGIVWCSTQVHNTAVTAVCGHARGVCASWFGFAC